MISQPTTWNVRLIRIVDSSSLHCSIYMYFGGCHLGAVLHPRGPLAICGDIFGSPLGIGNCFWHLVGRGRGYC